MGLSSIQAASRRRRKVAVQGRHPGKNIFLRLAPLPLFHLANDWPEVLPLNRNGVLAHTPKGCRDRLEKEENFLDRAPALARIMLRQDSVDNLDVWHGQAGLL